jgi:ligand-binding sensor domain-containing protein
VFDPSKDKMSAYLSTSKNAILTICCVSLLALFASRDAVALNPRVAISQYAHTTWRVQDGAFQGVPSEIAQTTDGYLWLGTTAGLYRFDGVRFIRVLLEGLPTTTPHNVLALLGASDGSLWVGNRGWVMQWKDGAWKRTLKTVGWVTSLSEAPNRVIWATQERTENNAGGFCSITMPGIQCYGKEIGVATANLVFHGRDGSLHVGLSSGVLEWKDGRAKIQKPPGIEGAVDFRGVSGILEEKDGSFLIGMEPVGPSLGLQHLSKAGVWAPYVISGFDGSTVSVTSLRRDRQGNLWIGTLGDGIYRFHESNVSHYSRAEGLSSNGTAGSFEDREGNIWFVTAMGIDRFHDVSVTTYTDAEGLNALGVAAVVAGRDGTIWLSNAKGLNFIRDGKIQILNRSSELQGDRITCLLEDSRGRLWVGVDNKLAVFDHERFRFVSRSDESPLGTIELLAEDADQNIWVKLAGAKPGKLVRIDGSLLRPAEVDVPHVSRIFQLTSDPRGGLWIDSVGEGVWHYQAGHAESLSNASVSVTYGARSISAQADGSLIGATSTGFFRWQNGIIRTFSIANGLPCGSIFSFIVSRQGSLWLYSECGIIEVTSEQLKSWWNNPTIRLILRWFSAADGALASLPTFTPKASESPDGRLWFATDTVLQMVDPQHQVPNLLRPPVHIEGVVADRKAYSPENGLMLPPRRGNLWVRASVKAPSG